MPRSFGDLTSSICARLVRRSQTKIENYSLDIVRPEDGALTAGLVVEGYPRMVRVWALLIPSVLGQNGCCALLSCLPKTVVYVESRDGWKSRWIAIIKSCSLSILFFFHTHITRIFHASILRTFLLRRLNRDIARALTAPRNTRSRTCQS